MATGAAAPHQAWPGLAGLREVFGHGPPPVSASSAATLRAHGSSSRRARAS